MDSGLQNCLLGIPMRGQSEERACEEQVVSHDVVQVSQEGMQGMNVRPGGTSTADRWSRGLACSKRRVR